MSDVANGAGGFNRLGLVRAYRAHGWVGCLHPVIPPWAWPEGGGKVPGVLDGAGVWHRAKGWQGEGYYARLEDPAWAVSHAARRAWGVGGAGIGVNARRFPALDVDIVDEAACEALRGFLREVFGPGCFLRVGRWPKFLMPFRLADGLAGVRKGRWELGAASGGDGGGAEGGAIELLGWGQQWVAEGTHGGTGVPYRWLEGTGGGSGRPVVSRLPVLGLEALSGLVEGMLAVVGVARRVRVGERSAVGPAARPMAELAGPEAVGVEVMRRWPNGPGRGVSYDVYVAVAHALWAASGGGRDWDGWRLFRWWAEQHPKADAAKDTGLWASVRAPRVGVEWLIGAVPGVDEGDRERRRRPGRGEAETRAGLVVTAGVRAGWLVEVATWRLRHGVGGDAVVRHEEVSHG